MHLMDNPSIPLNIHSNATHIDEVDKYIYNKWDWHDLCLDIRIQ